MSLSVLFDRHGSVGLITLNRPEKLNAFAEGMRDELAQVTEEARSPRRDAPFLARRSPARGPSA